MICIILFLTYSSVVLLHIYFVYSASAGLVDPSESLAWNRASKMLL